MSPYFRRRYGIGRRGAFLVLMGLIYAAIGASIFSLPPSETQRAALGLLTQVTRHFGGGYGALGWAWVGCGALAVGLAFGGARSDAWGYKLLVLPPALWAAVFAISGVIDGRPAFAFGVFIYVALTLCIAVIAGWPEPPEVP